MDFKLVSEYTPLGDQPGAIEALAQGVLDGDKGQTLMGVTGSGKTFTIANVIEKVNRPTLVLAHNKTLAAQLCSEFKEFFPENAVEYFVSYYDFFQPEAYLPGPDSYIEKDSTINDEINRLRHSATAALAERRDVIIVASVSCIYTLGDPASYRDMTLSLRQGQQLPRNEIMRKLVALQYERNDINFISSMFRVRGDVVEIFPPFSADVAIRVEFFGDEIERISEIQVVTGNVLKTVSHIMILPASHYIASPEGMKNALDEIEKEMWERYKWFTEEGKILEAHRLKQRTLYDLEMLQITGSCKGIENYSRIMSGRPPGSIPYTLMDHFPEDYLLVIDESHVTLPQVRGMFGGDNARKKNLVDYGFRLPSAYDNRPLNFDEFLEKVNQTLYVSATPQVYERENSIRVVEQIIRPTGLLDPEIEVKPVEGQIDDLIGEINARIEKKERVIITTLTRKMAEDLSDYFENLDIKAKYMHYEVDTIERMALIRDLRLGAFDVLIGINLLREGLDLPEVSLIAILDADKEGFLRNETSLIQTIGRAARNENGKVIMYADKVTPSMERAMRETYRRRDIQDKYNKEHGIIPKTITKNVREILEISKPTDEPQEARKMTKREREGLIEKLTKEMKNASKMLEFEHAAYLRDRINQLKDEK